MPMSNLLLSFEGTTLGSRLPRFEVRTGDFVCLHMPCLWGSPEEKHIIHCLTGKIRLPGMQILGRICIAKPAPSRNGWQTLFSWSSPTRWLKRAGGMSDREAAEITSRL